MLPAWLSEVEAQAERIQYPDRRTMFASCACCGSASTLRPVTTWPRLADEARASRTACGATERLAKLTP
jgi:hypothetical protein